MATHGPGSQGWAVPGCARCCLSLASFVHTSLPSAAFSCCFNAPAPTPHLQGVSTSQFDVRDVIWREDVGGEQLELGEALMGLAVGRLGA